MCRRAAFCVAVAVAFLHFPDARAADPRQGREYEVIRPAVCMAPNAPTVEVVEIFSYTCIHCYRLEQTIKGWIESLPQGVKYYKLPVTWGAEEALARMYWAMHATGVATAENDMAVFREIHIKRSASRTDADVARIVQRIGLDANRLRDTGGSFLVSSRVRRGTNLVRSWRITGTPGFVVAGKYRVVSTRQNAMSQSRLLEVVRWLAERELKAGRAGCPEAQRR